MRTVYLVIGNDMPEAVFTDETNAQKLVAINQIEEEKIRISRMKIHWRYVTLDLDPPI